MSIRLPKIYPITDRGLSGRSHLEQVNEFIAGGAGLVQIRDKGTDSGLLLDDISSAVSITRESGCIVIVNDRVDLALLAGADGVHLGQDDLSANEARKLLGKDRIIGVSTHSLAQVTQVLNEGIADYLAFGPIYATATKADHEPVVGLELLSQVKRMAGSIPIVAIGGITSSDLMDIFTAGADSAAMISEFYSKNVPIKEAYRRVAAVAAGINNVDIR